jgi:predicted nucleotidyltransferase
MTLSIDPERPVTARTLAVIREIANATSAMRLPYLLVGASARDLLLKHVFDVKLARATNDLDFAVAVASWDQFEALRTRLLRSGSFAPGPREVAHRIQYVADGLSDPVDLLPFGGVESPAVTIAWPPDMKILMNVIGYEDALSSSIEIKLDESLNVPVASLPGLALLKLFAWADRGLENPKDALDLVTLFRAYPEAGNMDRIYGEAFGILEQVEYDLELAGPRLLGHDVRRMARSASLDRALELLNDASKSDLLAVHMTRELNHAADPVAAAHKLIAQFRFGLAGRQG